MSTSKYYPALSELVKAEDLPEVLNFVKDGITQFFDKIFYKDLFYSKSMKGDSAFYSLSIVSRKRLDIELPGTGIFIVLNPDFVDGEISSFPVTVFYDWKILAYQRYFDLSNFSFSITDTFNLLLDLLDLTEEQVVELAVRLFVVPSDPDKAEIEQFTDDLNLFFGTSVVAPDPSEDEITDLVAAINQEVNQTAFFAVLSLYILPLPLNDQSGKIADFFSSFLPTDIETYLKDLFIPTARATFELSAGIEFPRKMLQPVYNEAGNNPYDALDTGDPLTVIPGDANDNPKVLLKFGHALFYADTECGLGYSMELALSTSIPAQIGNTGLIFNIQNLKIDLSSTQNIAEADADGRPNDFMGVYIENVEIFLPKKWFSDIDDTRAKIFGNNLLIGTGGISGTIGLEATGGDNMFWATLGSNDGFKLGFHSFDIEFKQNKVLSSNIQAAMEIKKFVYPAGTLDENGDPVGGDPVRIGIKGHIHDDGSFNLTASTEPPYPIELEGAFIYHISSLELGKQDDDFYIGTSGSIEFQGFLKETLKLKNIDIERLRIYSDGTIEIEGGTIALTEPIVLPLGPVQITVTAIHYGSHQKEVNGVMRKFNYFGFDGGISIDPLGIEVRGDSVNFYYCTDDLPEPKPKPYLHIKTLYLDLTIPASSPVAIINGWLSIPEPGESKEYAGGIKLQLPQAKIAGSADMKLMPKYPAFIIDVSIDLPAPITIGPVGIFAFRGLLGYRYVAEKEAAGLVSGVNSWYEYYKAPPRGIHVRKFNGPDKTKLAGTPFSIGAGASLGTSADNGTIINIKAMILLSIPSLFMIDGKAAVLSARLGLEDSGEPPFFAFVAVGDNSLELGFGADFKMPTKTGKILTLYADIQAAFFFKDSTKWYVNIGTRTNPVTARVLTLLTIKSYLMLSARGIEAGARGEMDFKRNYGPIHVRAWAYIEIGGKISFERPQFGGYMMSGVGADIDIKIVSLYAAFDVLFGVEGSKPYKIYGEFRLCVSIKIAWVFKFKFCGNLAIMWEFEQDVDRTPIDPLINAQNLLTNPDIVKGLVKGVNMLSNETFELAYLGTSIPSAPTAAISDHIIPLDTYIDFKTEKPFLPGGAVTTIIGGYTNPADPYTEFIPPEKIINGKEVRQVKHQYSIESLVVKSWNPAASSWNDYHPYKALYPADPALDNLKIGQFQKTGSQYNTIRLLATTPFSYTEQGQPGWFIPEQNGITAASLFCEGKRLKPVCANFLEKPLGTKYYCYNSNQLFYSQGAAFLLLNRKNDDAAQVVHEPNVFGFDQSISFRNNLKLQVRLPEPSVEVVLRLTTYSQGVRVKYYASLINDHALVIQYGNPDQGAADPSVPYVETYSASQLDAPVIYHHPAWLPVTRIEIEPMFPNQAEIDALTEAIAAIEHRNNLVELKLATGEPQPATELREKLSKLRLAGCRTEAPKEPCKKDLKLCALYDTVLAIQQKSYMHLAECTAKNQDNCPCSLEQGAALWEAMESVLKYLYESGNCGCSDAPVTKCYTLLHSVCWLSLEKYQYNINIPGQAAITADTKAAIEGLSGYIQPIWRPYTHYIVQFQLKDDVDNGAGMMGLYTYTYGFTTGGPLGFFHKHPKATYGDLLLTNGNILEDANGIVRTPAGIIVAPNPNNVPPNPVAPLTPHPELYALTSLTRYIDYNRSYPNADGNLLNSKPLFYNDETTQIYLFYSNSKEYAVHFFHSWQMYNGQPAVAGRIKIVIKDPREGSEIVNPPRLDYDENDTQYTHIPQTIESWEDDPNPIIPHMFEQYANLVNANECLPFGGNTIIPPSKFLHVKLKHLKPLKLYTAIVNNLSDLNNNGVLEPDNRSLLQNQLVEETVEVHKFTFQTSRYVNFEEQVNSYLLTDADKTVTRAAIFPLDKQFTQTEIQAAFDTIAGNPNALNDSIITNYQHAFDRVIEGLLGFTPMDKAMSTEFNVVRNTGDGNKIIALIIRNPEPFNNPKIPVEDVLDTIRVLDSSGNEDGRYHKLFSKDYSQVIIMKNGLEIIGPLDFRFTYKIWDGTNYIIPGPPHYSATSIGAVIVNNLDIASF